MRPRLLAPLLALSLIAGNLFAQPIPALSPLSAATTSPPTITATFWNLQWFPGRRPNASRAEENRQIRAVHRDLSQFTADIIGLEEVRNFEQASLAIRPLNGFKVDVCSNFRVRDGQKESQQIAIASRLPPISAW